MLNWKLIIIYIQTKGFLSGDGDRCNVDNANITNDRVLITGYLFFFFDI